MLSRSGWVRHVSDGVPRSAKHFGWHVVAPASLKTHILFDVLW